MSSATPHLAHREVTRPPTFSTTPLSDPAQILQRMPTQAISPALLELLDLMSGPILLIKHSPAGELREMAPAKPALAKAA